MKFSASLRRLAEGGVTAALYAALTLLLAPFSFGAVQVRLSEILTILPVFSAAAVPGLTVGCFLANLAGLSFGLTGGWDLLFGTAATLLAAMTARALRSVTVRGMPLLSALAAPVFNALIVGAELALFFSAEGFSLPLYAATALWVGLGELAAATVGGLLLFATLRKTTLSSRLFREE